MIQYLDQTKAFQELCRATKKWGMLICLNWPETKDPIGELLLAAPYLNSGDHTQLIADSVGVVLADTEEEIYNLYDQTVGDDGPTDKNPYNGPARVYALTCDNEGYLHNENT